MLQRSLCKWFKEGVLISHKIAQSSENKDERQSSAGPQHYFLRAQEMMIPIPVFSVQPVILAAEKHNCNISSGEWLFPPALLMRSLVQRQVRHLGALSREHTECGCPCCTSSCSRNTLSYHTPKVIASTSLSLSPEFSVSQLDFSVFILLALLGPGAVHLILHACSCTSKIH